MEEITSTGLSLTIGAECLAQAGGDLYAAFLGNPESAADIVLHAATDALRQGPETAEAVLGGAAEAYERAMADLVQLRC